MIISDGNLKSSFVVMKLDEYLKEIEGKRGIISRQEALFGEGIVQKDKQDEKKSSQQELTNEKLLDRINTDIAQLRSRNVEKEAIENFQSEDEGVKYDYESVR